MVMHMDMGDMAMEVMVMEVMAMDMVKVMAMAMDMATEDTQMKKTLNILKKMKVSTSVPRVIAEIGCNHMGDFDLAKKMIKLSGLTVKDENNKSGDIEIIFKGLRTGEKLYEELLIDAESIQTIHPQIFRAKEKFITPKKLWPKIKELKNALNCHNKDRSLDIISDLIQP